MSFSLSLFPMLVPQTHFPALGHRTSFQNKRVGFGWRPDCCTFPLTVAIWGVGFGEVETARHEVSVLHCRGAGWQHRRKPSKRKVQSQYYKLVGRPDLILRERTKTDDDELLADAFQAAADTARALGGSVQ